MNRLAAMIMAALIAHIAYAQEMAPRWIQERWRSANYPSSAWYTGFAENTLPPKANTAEYLKALERDALNKLAEGISVRVSGTSTVENTNLRTRQIGGSQSASSSNYRQKIQASANAEIAKSEVFSYHDRMSGKIYALAAVRKSDLASYYVSRADYHIQRAENATNEARQLTGLGKRSDALKKSSEGTDNLDECVQYLRLLSAVDYGDGESKRLLARETALRQEITAAIAEMEQAKEAKVFYVGGTETLGGARSDILISKLKSVIAKNGYTVDDDHRNADYNLLVEAKECDKKSDRDFTYCYACVRVNAVNLKTGKTEGRIDFKGAKAGLMDGDAACRKAFENAADEVWVKIKEDISVFK